MPRYFFDVRDGQFTADSYGTELVDLDAAKATAMSILQEVAPQCPSNCGFSEQEVIVRSEEGTRLLKAILTYRVVEFV